LQTLFDRYLVSLSTKTIRFTQGLRKRKQEISQGSSAIKKRGHHARLPLTKKEYLVGFRLQLVA